MKKSSNKYTKQIERDILSQLEKVSKMKYQHKIQMLVQRLQYWKNNKDIFKCGLIIT